MDEKYMHTKEVIKQCVCKTHILLYIININRYAFFLFLSSKIFLGARDQVHGLIIARDVCFH